MLVGTLGNIRAASQTQYAIEEQNVLQQISSASTVAGYSPLEIPQISAHAKVDTVNGVSLSAAPILAFPSPPGGSVTFPVGTNNSPTEPTGSGYNNYFVILGGDNGSGAFTFTMGNATARPTLSLNTASPVFPPTPLLVSGGTWTGGAIFLDPTVTNTLTYNVSAFTTYSNGLGGKITYHLLNTNGNAIVPKQQSLYIPTVGFTSPPLATFTISTNAMTAGQTYIVQADFGQIENVNTQSFTGTGISGSPGGAASDTSSTFITIQTVPELACISAGNQVIVSWPSTVSGWTLQTNNNLATGAWGNYLGSVGNNSATNSHPAGTLFFRLTHP